ncbi:MAG: hypothetical protein H7274_12895 [Rhodoferax sp.]|nr:hypothetical protein [Rhodoferax sp.]
MFTHFHGAIHRLSPRGMWQAYSDHRISQDLLFDAHMLLASAGAASMTNAIHCKTIHPASVTASTNQTQINAEYALSLETEANPCIQQLFREKLQVGKRYERLNFRALNGASLSS